MADLNEQTEASNHAASSGVSTDTLSGAAFEFFRFIGLFGIRSAKVMGKAIASFYKSHIRKYTVRIDAGMLGFIKKFSKAYKFVIFKFYMFFKFFGDAKEVIKTGYHSHSDASIPAKCVYAVGAFAKGARNNKRIFVTAVNYALPVIAAVVFINLISYVSTLNFAVSVEYNGQDIGYVADESVFEQAENKLQERMTYTENDEAINDIPKFTIAIAQNEKLKTDSELTDTIIRASSGEIVQALGLTIDGKFYGAVKDGQALISTLESIKEEYKTNTPGEEVTFARNVETDPGLYKAANLVNEEDLTSTLTAQEEKDVYYSVASGDTPIQIASKNDMTLDELVALNGDILTNCKIGKQVQVKRAQAFLPVKVIREETYDQKITFATTYTESSKIYSGQKRTVRTGEDGLQTVTAKVEYVDGVEVGRNVVGSPVIKKEPVDAVIEKGTMAVPKAAISRGNVSDYGFQWPVSGGYISQHYGNYGHNGLDYAYRGNGYGQPIWAAIPGTVTSAGWNGSYGNLVVITSPGGIQTWYAHCSSLLVSVGQTVGQGQQIGRIGSTGRSTGNHLHFRVLVNGVQRNPMNYLP